MSASESENVARRKPRRSSRREVGPRNTRRLGRTVRVAGADVYLTPTEYRLFAAFRRKPEHAFTRAELAAVVMPDSVVLDRTIDVHVTSLRRKLAGGSECIETVYGVGYRLAPK